MRLNGSDTHEIRTSSSDSESHSFCPILPLNGAPCLILHRLSSLRPFHRRTMAHSLAQMHVYIHPHIYIYIIVTSSKYISSLNHCYQQLFNCMERQQWGETCALITALPFHVFDHLPQLSFTAQFPSLPVPRHAVITATPSAEAQCG